MRGCCLSSSELDLLSKAPYAIQCHRRRKGDKVDQGWGWRQLRTLWVREPTGYEACLAGLRWSEPRALLFPWEEISKARLALDYGLC